MSTGVNPNDFTDRVAAVVGERVPSLAREHGHSQTHPAHAAEALLLDQGSLGARVLREPEVSAATSAEAIRSVLRNRFFNRLPKQDPPPLEIQHGSGFVRFLQAAHARQKEARSAFLGEQHLLAALADDKSLMQALASEAGLTGKMLLSGIASVTSKGGDSGAGARVNSRTGDSHFDALKKYALNLNEQVEAGELDPVIGRDAEIRRAVTILSRRTKNNPVLVGAPGVGKTAIVEGLAARICSGDVPRSLQNVTLWSLDMGALLPEQSTAVNLRIHSRCSKRSKQRRKSLPVYRRNAPVNGCWEV